MLLFKDLLDGLHRSAPLVCRSSPYDLLERLIEV